MRAYLMTRGIRRDLDYDFVGASPPDRWWRSLDDRDLVVLEEPAVLARNAEGSTGILVSGLPSSRRDVLGTRIRHTLVVDGLEADSALAGRLAATALDPDGRHRLGKELDGLLPIEAVEAALSGDAGGAEIGELLENLLRSAGWATEPAGDVADREGSWAASLNDPRGRADFLARIAALADGREGHAFVTHSLTTTSGAGRAAAELPGDTAILLADGEIGGVVALGKGVDAVAGPTRPGVPLTAGLTAVALIAVIVLTILLL
ncbi:hypothetical protein [Actinomadura sp. 3N407]|uniref:hypothetical protein n=1 Tax=Actinomadura sp. 3N407 TaxID=3457423 RepID=UPI003FCC6FBD